MKKINPGSFFRCRSTLEKDNNADVSAIDEALNDNDDDEDDDNDEDECAPGWDEISFAEQNPLNNNEQQDDDNPNDDLEGDNVRNLITKVLSCRNNN